MKQKNILNVFLSQTLLNYLVEKSFPQEEEETLQQTEECLRFLYLSHLTKGAIPVNQKIDDIWHLLILQTQEYFELCQKLPAKSFIHHSSKVYMKYQGENLFSAPEEEAKRHLEWLLSYIAHFGDMTDVNIKSWSFATALQQKLNITTEKFNSELRKLSDYFA